MKRWKKFIIRKNIERIIFAVILVFSMILMVLINIKLNNIYILQKSRTLNSWLYIEKDMWKRTIFQKNENENINKIFWFCLTWRYSTIKDEDTWFAKYITHIFQKIIWKNIKMYIKYIYIYTWVYLCNCTINCTCIAVYL